MKINVASDLFAPLQDIVTFLFPLPTFEQICLFAAALRSFVPNKDAECTRTDRGLLVDRLCLGRGKAGMASSAVSLIRTELPIHSLEDKSDHLRSILPFSVSSPPVK